MSDNNNPNQKVVKKIAKKKQREGGVEPNPKRSQGVLESPAPMQPDQRGAEGAASSSTLPPQPSRDGPERPVGTYGSNSLPLEALSQCNPTVAALIQSMIEATKRETELRMELEEERRKSASRETQGGGAGEAPGMSEIGYLIENKAPMEASRAPLKAKNLEGCELPESWPRYVWPKAWSGADNMVAALIALKELQASSTLQGAIKEFRERCRRNKRSLEPNEWRLLQPIIAGKESPHEHDAWEICLSGDLSMGTKIAHWLYVCREVNPTLVRETRQWVAIIGGGQWPTLSTGGQNVGRLPNNYVRQDHPNRFGNGGVGGGGGGRPPGVPPNRVPTKAILDTPKAPITTMLKKEGKGP